MARAPPLRSTITATPAGITQTLGSLERDGLLTRSVTATVPVTVTFELTELGLSLQEVMREIKAWAESNMDEVLVRRAEAAE